MQRPNRLAVFVGLMVAWAGPAVLISPAARMLGPPDRPSTEIVGTLLMWALLGAIVGIVVFWEKQPLKSLGLRPFSWRSIGWGLLLAAVTIYVVLPVLSWTLRVTALGGFETGMARVLALPLGLRLFAAVTAGFVEDGLFLGYAFTRLAQLTGSCWLGGFISVAAAALLHFPHWGVGPVLAYLVTGTIATAFFVWRRDLLANMIAHATVDTTGLVIVPLLSRG
jgi:membrane protease YdiL (CAAX protease family)